ncbi:MAG TPA: tetratricopeptide repeat protein [Rudaea sp.]|nr:tetratricopeptide repeat protein [Rudaea sp.]
MQKRSGFFHELRRRNVFRMAGLYVVGAWLIIQVSGTVLPMFDAPAWLPRSLVFLLAIGFVPALIFSWVFELTPEGLRREGEVPAEQSIMSETGQRMNHMIIAVLVLALAFFGFDKFVLEPKREAALVTSAHEEATKQASAPSAPAVNDKSIAVLPLANASGNKDEQFFSDGLSENLIIALSQFDGLTVIGRNSSFQFRDSKDDSRTIGEKLGVATLLEGSVQHAGDVVRVSAELINAANGHTLWSERYDRPYRDLFALQDDITKQVASALKAKLLTNAGASARTDRPPSGNLDAYTAFLQGKFYVARLVESDDRQAIAQFTTATRLDPSYALAWAELSQTATGMAARFLDGEAAQQAYAQARQAAETALRLAPEMAAAHGALGFLRLTADFDWSGAEAELRRAVELAPNEGAGLFTLGNLRATLGQPESAITLTRQALATDPLNARWHAFLALYLSAIGQQDEAKQAVLKAIALQPGGTSFHQTLAIIEILRGDARAALAAARQESPGPWQDLALALAQQAGGDSSAADAALKNVVDKHATLAPYQIAEIYALRDDADETFEWLDSAWNSRDPGIEYLLTDPLILRYQNDPRFAAFCKKAGLPTTTTAKAMR